MSWVELEIPSIKLRVIYEHIHWETRGECEPVHQALAGVQLTEVRQDVAISMAILAHGRIVLRRAITAHA